VLKKLSFFCYNQYLNFYY